MPYIIQNYLCKWFEREIEMDKLFLDKIETSNMKEEKILCNSRSLTCFVKKPCVML